MTKNEIEKNPDKCKICDSQELTFFAHTARCRNCKVLLCWPYPPVREINYLEKNSKLSNKERLELQKAWLNWHLDSGDKNHHNFTNMSIFALDDKDRRKELTVLDYGGGGGQFSLVLKSLFPLADSYIVDMQDNILLDIYRPLNKQIKFEDFENDNTKFDIIFLNDVYEHVTDPIGLLKTLNSKLKDDGKIFIDTPCQFWLYPVTKIFSKSIHTKLLKGTVDHDHQQIWSKKSFDHSLDQAGFKAIKYKELSEYTQPASFYMNSMGITNPLIRLMGFIFFSIAPFIAKNKIMCVATKKS